MEFVTKVHALFMDVQFVRIGKTQLTVYNAIKD